MASLKEVKNRIASVKNTRKITSAMRMVASAKLHRAQGAIENMLPYQNKMYGILTKFLSNTDGSFQSVYTAERPVKRIALVAFSSNSALAGGFNANSIRLLSQVYREYENLGNENILVYPVGRKVEEAARKYGCQIHESFQDMADKPSYEAAAKLAAQLMELYAEGEIDKVILIYHHFKTMGSQAVMNEQFLPIDLNHLDVRESNEADEDKDNAQTKSSRIDYIVEPSVEEFIADLLPQVLKLKLYTALLDSNASEHAARTLAMQGATDNADELIQDLSKQYNKSRQQAITNELLDIIGGSFK